LAGTADGAFVKLFVGSVPRTITEDEVSCRLLLYHAICLFVVCVVSSLSTVLVPSGFSLLWLDADTVILQVRPMFAEHGNVLEVAIIKDKRTGNQQGACCAVILCLWFNTCLQCKILQFISEYLSIGAHMVRMCTVFLCLALCYLCNFVLGIVSFRQAGVVERRVVEARSCRDQGIKGRNNEVLFAYKTHHVLGSSLTEEQLFFIILVHSLRMKTCLQSSSHECRGLYDLLWLVQ
jgi:hypothetical protein